MVWSQLPVARVRPSGEKATAKTPCECPPSADAAVRIENTSRTTSDGIFMDCLLPHQVMIQLILVNESHVAAIEFREVLGLERSVRVIERLTGEVAGQPGIVEDVAVA